MPAPCSPARPASGSCGWQLGAEAAAGRVRQPRCWGGQFAWRGVPPISSQQLSPGAGAAARGAPGNEAASARGGSVQGTGLASRELEHQKLSIFR